MKTLIVDSSDYYSSAILSDGGQIVAADMARGRPLARLHLLIDRVLKDGEVSIDQLDSLAVVTGPGSWIGIQTAVTTAKTLAQLANVQLIPLSRLDALTWSCRHHVGVIGALIDANNENLYCCFFSTSDTTEPISLTPPGKRSLNQVCDAVSGYCDSLVLVGSGAINHWDVLAKRAAQAQSVSLAPIRIPQVESLVSLAEARSLEALRGNKIFALEPQYLIGNSQRLREFHQQ